MNAHAYTLRQGALLMLCAEGDTGGQPLATALRQALRQGCHHVWVDCRHLATLPPPLVRRLRWYAARLWAAGSCLLLCHLSASARAALAGSNSQPLAASPLDAALYGFDCPLNEAAN